MQLSQIDITATDSGTTTSFVDSSGNPIASSAVSMVPPPADTSAMDAASSQAVSTSTDPLGNLDITKLIGALSSSYVSVQRAIDAGSASPYTAGYPTPGIVRMLPGGVRTVVNADGSTTITDASGKSQTVLPNGTVVQGGAPLIPGISNTTLMIGGAALLAALFFLGKR
ncbi:MAG TPA: hypothetical protein VNO25_07000 [Streptosporangiaceae bacterium]|nr:hypothetical protein [Streptosporangiaceae bacterium]